MHLSGLVRKILHFKTENLLSRIPILKKNIQGYARGKFWCLSISLLYFKNLNQKVCSKLCIF